MCLLSICDSFMVEARNTHKQKHKYEILTNLLIDPKHTHQHITNCTRDTVDISTLRTYL